MVIFFRKFSVSKSFRIVLSNWKTLFFNYFRVIQSADTVMNKSLTLIEEARTALLSGEDVNSQDLINISKDVTAALNQCVSCLPGQKDVDEVISSINDASQILSMNEYPQTNKSYG